MKTFKLTLLVLLTLSFFGATPALADYLPNDATQADRVEGIELLKTYLTSSDFVPSRLEFRKLSADAVGDLAKLATERRYDDVVRARALQSLALYADDARAVATIDGLLEQLKPSQKLYPAAVVAYGAVHGEAVTEQMIALAGNERAEVRMAAVVAMGRFGGQSGYEALIELASVETNPKVLARIQSYTR